MLVVNQIDLVNTKRMVILIFILLFAVNLISATYYIGDAGNDTVIGFFTDSGRIFNGQPVYEQDVYRMGYRNIESPQIQEWVIVDGDADANIAEGYEEMYFNDSPDVDGGTWQCDGAAGILPAPYVAMGESILHYSDDRYMGRADSPGQMVSYIRLDLESINGERFTDLGSVNSYRYSVSNIPSGMSVSAYASDYYVTFTLTGSATNHDYDDDVLDLTITLYDNFFDNGDASAVLGSTSHNIKVDFPYFVNDLSDLQTVSDTPALWDEVIYQTADIDAELTSGWNEGDGFSPIGTDISRFTGRYFGQGYTISNLYTEISNGVGVGLFGKTDGAWLMDLVLEDIDIQGSSEVGGLAGSTFATIISNCSVSGDVQADLSYGGGLVGYCGSGSSISESCSSADVWFSDSDANYYGGFLGSNYGDIDNCYSTGDVSGAVNNGISQGRIMGGFCGIIVDGELNKCYSSGGVYMSPGVVWSTNDRGFLGSEYSGIYNSFFNTETSGQPGGYGAIGITTAQMRDHNTFEDVSWDFILETTNGEDDLWDMDQRVLYNNGFPLLSWQDGVDEYVEQYFSGGNGTEASPWEIATLEDLRFLSENVDEFGDYYYIQTGDIDASDTANWNDEGTSDDVLEGFLPIGRIQYHNFEGEYNGNYHIINNLTINRTESTDTKIGLFGYMSWGEVHDLGLENVNIMGYSEVGGFVGKMDYATISRCYTTGVVYAEDCNVGGFVGYAVTNDYNGWDNIIENCYTKCIISSNGGYSGGFMGKSWYSITRNCYSTGTVSGSGNNKGFCGYSYHGSFSSCFWDEETSGIDVTAGYVSAKLSWEMKIYDTFSYWDFVSETAQGEEDIWDMDQEWTVNGGYPLLSWQEGADTILDYTYGGGDGIDGDPFLITNLEHLNKLSYHKEDYAGYFLQTADIEASETENWNDGDGFLPIGDSDYRFTGNYDGGEHIISGLYINSELRLTGLFGYVDGGTITSLGVIDGELIIRGSDNSCGGLLAGGAGSYPTIRECFTTGTIVDSTIDCESIRLGGMCGSSSARYYDCYSIVDITSRDGYAGGMNGDGGCRFERCYAAGNIQNDIPHHGGLSGDEGSANNSFWNIELSNQENGNYGDVGYGLSNAQMLYYRSFTNTDRITLDEAWDFVGNEYNDTGSEDIWDIDQDGIINYGLPILSWQPGGDNILPDSYPLAGSGGEGDPWLLEDIDDLQYINEHFDYWGDYFALTSDIDASATQTWNSGDGFISIGNAEHPFYGGFDGQGHVISDLYINRPDQDYQAPFGVVVEAKFYQLGFDNVYVYGDSAVAGFVASVKDGGTYSYIDECFSKGEVHATEFAGGFAAGIDKSLINNCYSRCSVEAGDKVGGFASHFDEYTLKYCYHSGELTSSGSLGGFLNTDYRPATFCFFDSDVCGTNSSASGSSKSTGSMQSIYTYTNYTYNDDYWWDFVGNEYNDTGNEDIWDMDQNGTENDGYPIFSWEEGADELVYPPAAIDLPEQFSLSEDQTRTYSFSYYITDYYDEVASIECSGDTLINVVINNSTLQVEFSAGLNWYGTEEMNFTIYNTDGDFLGNDDIQIVFNSVNDRPVITLPDTIRFAEDTEFTVDFSGYVSDPDGDILTLTSNTNTYIGVTIDDYMVTFNPVDNWSGNQWLGFYVNDDASRYTDSDGVRVVVDNTNDTPFVTASIDNFSFTEDYSNNDIDLNTVFDDPDMEYGDNLAYTFSGNTYIEVVITDGAVNLTPEHNWNGSEVITFTATDDSLEEASEEVEVTINYRQDNPYLANPIEDFSFDEDTIDTHINLYDYFDDADLPYGGTLTFTCYNNEHIAVDVSDSVAVFTNELNWSGTEYMYIKAKDDYNRYVYDYFYVTVDPTNDFPLVAAAIDDFSFLEDYSNSDLDLNDVFTDPDLEYGDNLTYSYAGNNHIEVEISNGIVTLTPEQNWNGTETIIFIATDDSLATESDEVEVTITYRSDNPYLVNPIANFSFDEDTIDQHINLYEVFNDADLPYGGTLTFTPYNNNHIAMEVSDSMAIFTPESNWSGNVYMYIRATDENNRYVNDYFTVTVNPVNDAPEMELPEELSFDEDGSLYNDFSAYISDIEEDTITLSCQEDSIITVEIIYGFGVNFSAEANWHGVRDLIFTATDSESRAACCDTVSIVVNGVNDDPYVKNALEDISIAEDGFYDHIDLNAVFSDADLTYGDTLAWSYSGNVHIAVEIIDGLVTLTPEANWFGIETLNFAATDSSLAEVHDDVQITVNSVNDEPYLITNLEDFSFDEDTTDSRIDLDNIFGDHDLEYGDHLTYICTGNSSISVNISQGVVSLSLALNWFGSETITFTASDDSLAQISEEVSITINALNDTPEIILPETFSFVADTTLTIDFAEYVEDAEQGDDLLLTAAGNTEIVIDIDFLMVTFSSDIEWSGNEDIIFTVNDTHLTASDTVRVTVLPSNHAPVISLPDSIFFNEDNQLVADFSHYITDEDEDDVLTLTLTGNTNIFVNITELDVTFSAVENWYGEEFLFFTIDDNVAPETFTDSIYICVYNVNDAPTVETALIDFSFNEDTTDNHIDLDDVFSDLDLVNGDELTYSFTGNTNIDVDISESIVTFTPDNNWNGNETITFMAKDDSLAEVIDDVIVTVNYMNDTPTVETALLDFNFNEDTSDNHIDLDGVFTDLDIVYGDSLAYSFTGNDSISVSISEGIVTFTPAANWNGNETITFTATDTSMAEVSDNVIVTINNLNDTPTVETALIDFNFNEDTTDSHIDLDDVFADLDLIYGDVLTYINTGNTNIGVEMADGVVTFTPDANWYGFETITFTATDNYTEFISENVIVTINNVNDAPTIALPATYSFTEDVPVEVDYSGYVADVDPADVLTLTAVGNDDIGVELMASW